MKKLLFKNWLWVMIGVGCLVGLWVLLFSEPPYPPDEIPPNGNVPPIMAKINELHEVSMTRDFGKIATACDNMIDLAGHLTSEDRVCTPALVKKLVFLLHSDHEYVVGCAAYVLWRLGPDPKSSISALQEALARLERADRQRTAYSDPIQCLRDIMYYIRYGRNCVREPRNIDNLRRAIKSIQAGQIPPDINNGNGLVKPEGNGATNSQPPAGDKK